MRRILFALSLVIPSLFISAASAQPGARATIFQNQDFRGDRRQLDGPVRDLGAIGMNDRVSSIRIDSGTWEFCEDSDFRGRCITLSRDEPNLAGSSIDDRISSARPVPGAARQGDNRGPGPGGNRGNDRGADVTLYADINYSGASRDSGESRDFRNLDFNDTASSIRIRAGTWQFCTDADFRGRCMTFDRDVPSLVPFGLNDAISSMRKLR